MRSTQNANGSGKCCSSNSNSSDEMKFGSRFVRALWKMRRWSRSSSRKQSAERIKRAAYRCMARAVGSRRAWSRAILFRLRSPNHHPVSSKMKRKRSSSMNSISSSTTASNDDDDDITRQVKKLRKVVPGGKCMDICTLLDETAHFVTSLNTQLSIMQAIAHHFSNSISS